MPLHRTLRRAAAALALTLTGWTLAGPALAEPPQDLRSEVTDTAGVLKDPVVVQRALDELADTTDLQLFVTYVDTFDGMDPAEWADRTAERSRLGAHDLLLAVAVDDRTYQVSAAPDAPLTDAQLTHVETRDIQPRLREGDWDGAAIAAAEGYADATRPGQGGRIALVVLVVLAVGGAAFLVVRVVRRRRAARAQMAALADEASVALVRVDDALAVWSRELDYASAELGEENLTGLRAALPPVRDRLTAAFAIRAQAEDAEGDGARGTALRRVVDECRVISEAVAQQTTALAALRDVHAQAPQHLAELAERAQQVTAAAVTADEQVQALVPRWADSATAAVRDAPRQAGALAQQAAGVVTGGQAQLDTDRPAAVAAVESADALLDRADALFQQVQALVTDLAKAPDDMARATASLTADLADADRLGGPDPDVAAAAARAREALPLAQASLTGGDPLAALAELARVEGALDAALAPMRQREEQAARARQRVAEQLPRVQREIGATDNLVRSERWTVGAQARERLSAAREHARVAAAEADPVLAALAVDRALEAVAAAQRIARSDMDEARRSAERLSSGGGWSGGGSWGGGSSWGWSSGGGGGGWSSGGGRSRSRSGGSSRSSSTRRSSSSSGRSRGSSGRSRRGGGGRF